MLESLYNLVRNDINEAFVNGNKRKIAKETSFVIGHLLVTVLEVHNSRLQSVVADIRDIKYSRPYVYSEDNRQALLAWLKRISVLDTVISDREFYVMKVDFEEWYKKISGKEIKFLYRDEYLLTPTDAAKRLGVSPEKLDGFIKTGMEHVLPVYPFRVPKHAVEVWKKQNNS